jgi:hypothetical protein
LPHSPHAFDLRDMPKPKHLEIRQTQPINRVSQMHDGVGFRIAVVGAIRQGPYSEPIDDEKNDPIDHVHTLLNRRSAM